MLSEASLRSVEGRMESNNRWERDLWSSDVPYKSVYLLRSEWVFGCVVVFDCECIAGLAETDLEGMERKDSASV